jgi:AraC-like DNA-binding protein
MQKSLSQVDGAAMAFARHARALLEQSSRIGVDLDAVLRRSQVSFSYKDIVSGRVTRLSSGQFCALRKNIYIQLLSILSPGGEVMSKEDFDLSCYGCLQATTLQQAIDRLSKYLSLQNGQSGRLSVRVVDAIVHVNVEMFPIKNEGKHWELWFLAIAFATLRRLFSWLIGTTIQPTCFRTIFTTPDQRQFDILMDGNEITFNQDNNEFCFPEKFLSRPIVRTHAELVEFLQEFPFSILPAAEDADVLARHIAGIYKSLMEKEMPLPTIPQLASSLGMSSATLRRRLTLERMSIREVKSEARKALAIEYLERKAPDIERLSTKLSFSSMNTFCRAFRGWTGLTLTEYRAQMGR